VVVAYPAKIEGTLVFARRSKIILGTHAIAETPLLLPSFSSKGFPQVRQVMDLMAEFITSPILISAYDVYYRFIPRKIRFSQLMFLDSGGYEARIDHDLSETYGKIHKPKPWNKRFHERVLASWASRWPTIAVSFDSPTQFVPLSKQIKNAEDLRGNYQDFLWEFLVKPESPKDLILPIEKLLTKVARLRGFAVIGLTEKELGDSVFAAMTNIARLRAALDLAGLAIPIHIFGSLDPLTTILYFLAGAEIFDGLTWLRFGYHDGNTIYSQNYGVLRDSEGLRRGTDERYYEMWRNNYYYLEKLRTQMINYERTKDFSHFGCHHLLLKDALTQLEAIVVEAD
jgi:hypothetical protein